MTDAAQASGPQKRDLLALYALFLLAIACPTALCLMPRALAPLDLPALQLSAAETEAVMQADLRAEKSASRSPVALELEREFLDHGEKEARGAEPSDAHGARMLGMHDTYLRLLHEGGPSAVLAMRARALGKFEAALDLQLPQEQQQGVLGVFGNVLESFFLAVIEELPLELERYR